MKTEAKCLSSSLYNGSRQELLPTANRLSEWKDVGTVLLNLSDTCIELVRNLLGTELLSNLSLQSVLYKFHFMIGGKEMAGKFHRRVL